MSSPVLIGCRLTAPCVPEGLGTVGVHPPWQLQALGRPQGNNQPFPSRELRPPPLIARCFVAVLLGLLLLGAMSVLRPLRYLPLPGLLAAGPLGSGTVNHFVEGWVAVATCSPWRRPVHGRGEADWFGGLTHRGDVDGCGFGGGHGGCGCSRCCNSKQDIVSAIGRPLARSRRRGFTAPFCHVMQVWFRVSDCLKHVAIVGGCRLACWAHPLACNSTGCTCCTGSWGSQLVSCHVVYCFGWYGDVASEVSALGRPQFRWFLRGGCRLLPAGCTMVAAQPLGLVFPSACHHTFCAGYGRHSVSSQEAHLPVGCSWLVPRTHWSALRASPGGSCSTHVVRVLGPLLLSRCWVFFNVTNHGCVCVLRRMSWSRLSWHCCTRHLPSYVLA